MKIQGSKVLKTWGMKIPLWGFLFAQKMKFLARAMGACIFALGGAFSLKNEGLGFRVLRV